MCVVYGRGLIFFKKWLKKNNKFERNKILKLYECEKIEWKMR